MAAILKGHVTGVERVKKICKYCHRRQCQVDQTERCPYLECDIGEIVDH
jgi:hypothetical protein